MNMTKAQLLELIKHNPAIKVRKEELDAIPDEKNHKYNARPEWFDGIYFDSQAEKNRYCELKLLKRAGIVRDFKVHPRYKLTRKRYYEADFEVEYTDGHIEVEDVKGFETKEFRLKADLFREKYPELQLTIIK